MLEQPGFWINQHRDYGYDTNPMSINLTITCILALSEIEGRDLDKLEHQKIMNISEQTHDYLGNKIFLILRISSPERATLKPSSNFHCFHVMYDQTEKE